MAMYLPGIFGENLFDNLMDFEFPRLRLFDDVDRKLYGKRESRLMKTDVHENDQGYEVDIDLPGFKKDEISLDLEDGYLSVSAAKGLDEEHKDEKGRVIRRERYTGAMKRSFFVGENVTEEDVKAKYENGVLRLNVPKKEAEKLPEKKAILIEG